VQGAAVILRHRRESLGVQDLGGEPHDRLERGLRVGRAVGDGRSAVHSEAAPGEWVTGRHSPHPGWPV
jgi:hypothetical protein